MLKKKHQVGSMLTFKANKIPGEITIVTKLASLPFEQWPMSSPLLIAIKYQYYQIMAYKKIIDTEVNYNKIPYYDTMLEIKNYINSKLIKYIGY